VKRPARLPGAVEPSRHLYHGHQYRNAASTDVRETWEAWKERQQAQPANVQPINTRRGIK
jgi:hypothetical protein